MSERLRARLLRLKEEADHLIDLIDEGQLQAMVLSDSGDGSDTWFRLPSFKVIDLNPLNEPDPKL